MLKKMALAVLTAAMLVGGTTAAAQAAPTDLPGLGPLIDGIVTRQLADDKIPGAAVVVVSGGKTVYAKGYGVADLTTHTPVRADQTEFFTGSVAKVFTATAVAQLVRQGKLDLHADVNHYLTAFKIRDAYPGRPVTLENLLTHTAGFDDDPVGVAVPDPSHVPQLGRYLADHQPNRVRPPGVLPAYDNYGVALAGYLVEVVSGEPFAQYVQNHILTPLGMTGTTFTEPHGAAIDAALARGYRPEGSGQTAESGQYGAWSPTGAGVVATATDLGTFLIAQLAQDPRLGAGVAGLIQEQHFTADPRLPGLGYLWEERPRDGRRLLFKDGDVPGFHSDLAMLPEQNLGIYVVYNGDGVDGSAGWAGKDLIHQVVDRYFPATGSPATPVTGTPTAGHAAALPATNGSAYAGSYRSDRTSHGALTKAATLVGAVTVEASADGSLTTTGLSPDPDAAAQHWTPLAAGLYQERGGQERIAFDGKGHLFTTQDPTVAFEKLAWYESPTWHQVLLFSGAGILAVAFLALPVLALVRKLRGRTPHPAAARAARALAWVTAALTTVFTVGFLVMSGDANAFNEAVILGSGSLTILLLLNSLAALTTIGLLAGSAAAWRLGWWGWPGRVGYTVLTAGSVSFLTIAYVYNLMV